MRLSDRGFWGLEALSIVCGELTFCIAAGIWFALSQVNWFSEWIFQIPIVLCWGLGALLSWLTAKSTNSIPLKTYIWTNCVYLALTIYNIRISRIRYNDKYQSLILCGNIVVNPFLDLYFLSGKTNGIKTITTFSKRKTYLFLRNVHIFWLLYTFAMVFYTPLIESRVGELCYIGLIIAVTAFIQRNISIAIRHDTPGYILLNVWLFFIYAPFYSRRVLKNNWL